jgi:hypothetical protein
VRIAAGEVDPTTGEPFASAPQKPGAAAESRVPAAAAAAARADPPPVPLREAKITQFMTRPAVAEQEEERRASAGGLQTHNPFVLAPPRAGATARQKPAAARLLLGARPSTSLVVSKYFKVGRPVANAAATCGR